MAGEMQPPSTTFLASTRDSSSSPTFSTEAEKFIRLGFQHFDSDRSDGLNRVEFSKAFFALARASDDAVESKTNDDDAAMSEEEFKEFLGILSRDAMKNSSTKELDLKGFTELLLSYYQDDPSVQHADRRLERFFRATSAVVATMKTESAAKVESSPIVGAAAPSKTANLMELLRPKKPTVVLPLHSAKSESESAPPKKAIHPFFLKPTPAKTVISLDSPPPKREDKVSLEKSSDATPDVVIMAEKEMEKKPPPSKEQVDTFLSRFSRGGSAPVNRRTEVAGQEAREQEEEKWGETQCDYYPTESGWADSLLLDFPDERWKATTSPPLDFGPSVPAAVQMGRETIVPIHVSSEFKLNSKNRVSHEVWYKNEIAEPLASLFASSDAARPTSDSSDSDSEGEGASSSADRCSWIGRETQPSCSDAHSQSYRPRSLNHFSPANKHNLDRLLEWMTNFSPSTRESSTKRRKVSSEESDDDEDLAWGNTDDEEDEDEESLSTSAAIVLFGPNGSGKTSAVYACAQALGRSVLESNASDDRTGTRLTKQLVGEASSSMSLGSSAAAKNNDGAMLRSTVVLVDEAHIGFEEDPVNFMASLKSLIKTSKCPVVVCFDDALPAAVSLDGETLRSSGSGLFGRAKLLKFVLPSWSETKEFCRHVAENEGYAMTAKKFDDELESSFGGFRRALTELQVRRAFSSAAPSRGLVDLSRLELGCDLDEGFLPWDITPRVFSVSPTQGKQGDLITIIGNFPFFDDENRPLASIDVFLGDVPCREPVLLSASRIRAFVGRLAGAGTPAISNEQPSSEQQQQVDDEEDVFETNASAVLSGKAKKSRAKKPLDVRPLPVDVRVVARVRCRRGEKEVVVSLKSDDRPEHQHRVLFTPVQQQQGEEGDLVVLPSNAIREGGGFVASTVAPASGKMVEFAEMCDHASFLDTICKLPDVQDDNAPYDGVRDASIALATATLRASLLGSSTSSDDPRTTLRRCAVAELSPSTSDLVDQTSVEASYSHQRSVFLKSLRRVGFIVGFPHYPYKRKKSVWSADVPYSLIMARRNEIARVENTKRRFTSYYRAGTKDAKRAASLRNTLHKFEYDLLEDPDETALVGQSRGHLEGSPEAELFG